jgi:hypothetical protein
MLNKILMYMMLTLMVIACQLKTTNEDEPTLKDLIEIQKLRANDGAQYDQFGFSVAADEDWAIIGAHDDDDMGSDSGSAYLFKWNGSSWTQMQKLTSSDGAAGDSFGCSVAIRGDTAILGAMDNDEKGLGSGAAYVFHWDGNTWVQQQKLTASDAAVGVGFGKSVAMKDDTIIIGAPHDDDIVTGSGSAYIFKWDGSNWAQYQKLNSSIPGINDWFGWSVAISGTNAIVGATGDDDKGMDSGTASVFLWNGSSWVHQQTLTASDGAGGDMFGNSVAIDDDWVLVGAVNDSDRGTSSGSAYIYKWNGTIWIQQQKFTADESMVLGYIGETNSVGINNTMAVVGACGDDDKGPFSGSVYILHWDGSNWVQHQKLTASDGAVGEYFGLGVAISDDWVFVGASYGDGTGTKCGKVYAFK